MAKSPTKKIVTQNIQKFRYLNTDYLKKLAGWYAIRDLQNGTSKYHNIDYITNNPDYEKEVKTEIIRLSVEYQILSKHTSFIAEEYRDNEVVEKSMVRQDLEESKNKRNCTYPKGISWGGKSSNQTNHLHMDLNESKSIMMENLSKLEDRGARINELSYSININDGLEFKSRVKLLKQSHGRKGMIFMIAIILLIIVVAIVLLIWMFS